MMVNLINVHTPPPIYYWEDTLDGVMTAAVHWQGKNYGLSFPLEQNVALRNMHKKKLITHLSEVSDVLYNHGERVLDSSGNIDPRLLNDAEAARWSLDPMWNETVKDVRKAIAVKEISREEAVKLQLLNEPYGGKGIIFK